jgi:hypothetical protein
MEIDKKLTQEDSSAESEYKRATCEKVTFKDVPQRYQMSLPSDGGVGSSGHVTTSRLHPRSPTSA